ncbi:sensor histidine kinase [uncultured Hymenobacter sp.]|uniref:sensor histidine kinase n=1 Tax=uncultured Hymenobacter sp. TaxID=170016 RepID=UPI0035CBE2D6
MNRARLLLYQMLGWGLIAGYTSWWQALRNAPITPGLYKILLVQLTFWFSLISLFYYCLLLVFPLGMRRGRRVLLVPGLLSTPIVFVVIRYGLEEVLLPLLFGFHNYAPGLTLGYYLQDNAYFILPMVALAAAVWGIKEAFLREKERENQLALQLLQQEKTQAELAFLKTQINPHFLYNTLNYLYSLAYPVSEPLAEAVLKLSALMRYMLHESPDDTVALAQEVDYLENYLSLYRLRFEDNFFVNFDLQGQLNGQRVPALLLIPFVENALKHGVTDAADRPIEIGLHLRPDHSLLFEVRNHIGQHQRDATTGIGLANLRRRLALLYPGRHSLTIHDDGAVHQTRLELPTP